MKKMRLVIRGTLVVLTTALLVAVVGHPLLHGETSTVLSERRALLTGAAGHLIAGASGVTYVLRSDTRHLEAVGAQTPPSPVISGLNSTAAGVIDGRGRFIVADGERIKLFDNAGVELREFSTPAPSGVATLSNGDIVVAASTGKSRIHLSTNHGIHLADFGQPHTFDPENRQQNQFLNEGLVLVDRKDLIYFVYTHSAQPTVETWTASGNLVNEFQLDGLSIREQAESARRFLGRQESGLVGGYSTVTAAALDPATDHLWIATAAQPPSGNPYTRSTVPAIS